MKIILILFLWSLLLNYVGPYEMRIPLNPDDICTWEPKCGSKNRPHSFCFKPGESFCLNFTGFHIIDINEQEKTKMSQAFNGLRNKIAGQWDISNMNYIYWDPLLETMAKNYNHYCNMKVADECNFIGSMKYNLTQIYKYVARPRNIIVRYSGRAIREWFRESKDIPDLETFKKVYDPESNNYALAVMMWPRMLYFACAAADIQNGFEVRCYFHPSLPKNHFEKYMMGEPGTACEEDRSTSETFKRLCGYDDPAISDRGRKLDALPNSNLFFIFTLFSYLHSILFNKLHKC